MFGKLIIDNRDKILQQKAPQLIQVNFIQTAKNEVQKQF
jgi:hypothetical protein